MFCENCKIQHDGSYGSGRFCTSKCSRSYSTKSKRKEINQKVSLSLRTNHGTLNLSCRFCKKEFSWSHFAQVAEIMKINETSFCSLECKKKSHENFCKSIDFRQKMSNAAIKRLQKGDVWFGKQCIVEAFNKKIRCDSLLEKSFILFMLTDDKVCDIERSNVWIPYDDKGVIKKYNPDFIVTYKDGTKAIAEVKSSRVGKKDVWEDYYQKSIIKMKILENYARDNGMNWIWYTQKTSPSFYREICNSINYLYNKTCLHIGPVS